MMQVSSKLDAVLEVARRYDYDPAHAHQVECLAGTLFMELEPLHKLRREDRKILEFASILHDIGYFLSSAGHHKHAMQLIMMEPLVEFTRSEKLMIANLVRYHRKVYPSLTHAPFAILTGDEQRRIELLAPLLRIADALDKTHRSVVKELACHIRDEDVILQLAVSDEIDLEVEAVQTRSEMFRTVYGRDIVVDVSSCFDAGAGSKQQGSW